MNKLLFSVLFFAAFSCFAIDTPMKGLQFESGKAATLNGRTFSAGEYAASFREQDGEVVVNGRKLHYWLYDTTTYHGGKTGEIYNRVLPYWVEKLGFDTDFIDYDDIKTYDPNTSLVASVKELMTQKGCDISMAFVIDNPNYVVINEYFKSKGTYKTTVYYVYSGTGRFTGNIEKKGTVMYSDGSKDNEHLLVLFDTTEGMYIAYYVTGTMFKNTVEADYYGYSQFGGNYLFFEGGLSTVVTLDSSNKVIAEEHLNCTVFDVDEKGGTITVRYDSNKIFPERNKKLITFKRTNKFTGKKFLLYI